MDIAKVEGLIYRLQGHRVMLDRDLAALYEVETGALNRAVKRNPARFPPDFMFQLKPEEWGNLKCRIGISRWGGDRAMPHAFTEHGVAMLSSVLNSPRAISADIEIMRAFTRLRSILAEQRQFVDRLDAPESRYDAKFEDVFGAIRRLVDPIMLSSDLASLYGVRREARTSRISFPQDDGLIRKPRFDKMAAIPLRIASEHALTSIT